MSQSIDTPLPLSRRFMQWATAGYAWWGILVCALSLMFLLAAEIATAAGC